MYLNFLTVDIRKSYTEFFLNVEFTIGKTITAVFGPTGSGKSTLLDCVSGFTTPDDGMIKLGDRFLCEISERRRHVIPAESRRIGYMFQRGFLFPHLKVKENIFFGYNLVPPALRRLEVQPLIELLELEGLLSRFPSSLSGGERQKVAMARALATAPDLLILDEPLANLDGPSRIKILEYLKLIHSELEIPMLYVSHSFPEVSALADRVIVLAGGKIIGDGPPELLLSEPKFRGIIFENEIEHFRI